MAMSAFADKARLPEEQEIVAVLGPTAPLWRELKEQLAARFAPLLEEWVFYGQKSGWTLRLKQNKRAVLYLTPCAGFFRAAFALGEKAAAAAHRSDLPAAVLDIIDQAPKYAEGRAVRFEVREADRLPWILTVAEIKMAH